MKNLESKLDSFNIPPLKDAVEEVRKYSKEWWMSINFGNWQEVLQTILQFFAPKQKKIEKEIDIEITQELISSLEKNSKSSDKLSIIWIIVAIVGVVLAIVQILK